MPCGCKGKKGPVLYAVLNDQGQNMGEFETIHQARGLMRQHFRQGWRIDIRPRPAPTSS